MTQTEASFENKAILDLLGKIYQEEMAGVCQYLHYSFMIMGHNRIPIQKWFRDNANEAMMHATIIGEKITSLGGHPPIFAAQVEENNLHTVNQLLEESLTFEERGISLYKELAKAAQEMGDIALEELARSMVQEEVEHADEVRKMLRHPDSM